MAKSIRKGAARPKHSRKAKQERKGKQPRPEGPFFQIGPTWKADIKALLESKGMSQAELARRIGASPGSIVLIFKDDTVQTRLAPAIHKALDLDPPTPALAAA